jgi:DedD protein
MDEQVKARLIGATILVVIAVALVPELLSGPRRAVEAEPAAAGSNGTRTVVIDIGDGRAAGAGRNAMPRVVEAPGEAAEPRATTVSAPPATAAPEIEPPAATVAATTPVVPPPAEVAPPSRTPTPTNAATGGGWSVQVGAFSAAATARKLVADLGKDGLTAYVAPLERGGKTLHRVRVGPVASKAEAEQLAARLKTRGMPGSVVGPD